MSTQEVLKWIQNRLSKEQTLFPDLECKNFTRHFADGKVFLAMLSIVDEKSARTIFNEFHNDSSESGIIKMIDLTFDRFLNLGVPR
jgi:hypothetical protein